VHGQNGNSSTRAEAHDGATHEVIGRIPAELQMNRCFGKWQQSDNGATIHDSPLHSGHLA
jgi:hypothetical protein